jgi:hypothetical protein
VSAAPSRLLAGLDARIATAPPGFDRDVLVAERACYRARQGKTAEALQAATALRERYAGLSNTAISVWVNLVEGLASYYDDLGDLARDKLQRAHAMSASRPTDRLHLLCAVWLAHVDYAQHDPDAMARRLRHALAFAGPDDHAVRARGSLVVAQALHLGSGVDRAEPWYAAVRHHALAEGDDLTIRALMRNRADLQLARFGEAVFATEISAEVAQAFRQYESGDAYARLIGESSQAGLGPLEQAQVLCARRDAAAALALFDAHIGVATRGGLARMAAPLRADQAWCRVQLGHFDQARIDARAALDGLLEKTHVDDLAATHSRLAQVHAHLGEHGVAAEHAALAARHWQEFRQLQERMAAAVQGIPAPGSRSPA